MDKEIRKIQIFIVTKNEVPNEFTEIRDFTNEINRHLEKAYSVSVDLMTIDDLDAPDWKQDEYKKQICESEIVFFLIFTEMTDFMKADFEVAFEKMRSDGKPDIYTYFYKGEDKEPEPLVREFINNLENGINHYWSVYSHIDTIKLKILMCLKLSKLDMVEMEFRDGKLVIDNRDVMPLDNVPMFADNDNMKSLKDKLKTVEEDYFSVKALYLEDKQNAEVRKKYIDLSTERTNLKQKIEETEKQLFTQSLNMIKTSRGELTPRQREAYRLFEEGKSEIANGILDAEEMKNDFKREIQILQENINRRATVHIKEFKTKIEILETMTEYKERFSEIVDAYEEIMETAFEYGVEYGSVYDYICFLDDQNKSQRALEIGRKLEKIYNENEEISLYDKSKLWNVLGMVTDSIPATQGETEKYYKKSIAIREELVCVDRDRFLPDLADSYNNTGCLYDDKGDYEQAKQYHFKAIAIREELVNMNRNRFLPNLAGSYNNAGILYYVQGDYEQAEHYHLKAIAIREELVNVNRDRFLPNLATSYNNAGILYKNQGDYKQAEHYYLKAIAIREELVNVNHDRFSPDLAGSYYNTGILYYEQRDYEQAEHYYLKAIAISEELVNVNRDRFLPDLASNYNNAGILYDNQQDYKQAEYYFLKAIAISEELVSVNRDRFLPDLASSYCNVSNLYEEQGDYKQAEYYHLKAIAIREELIRVNRDRFLPDLAISYNNTGNLYNDQGNYKQAERYHLKAIAIREELIRVNRDRFLPNLANSYNNVGALYVVQGDYKQAEHYYLKAIVIREELTNKNAQRYESDLAVSYFNYAILKDNDNNYLKKAFKLAGRNLHDPRCKQIFEQLKPYFN